MSTVTPTETKRESRINETGPDFTAETTRGVPDETPKPLNRRRR
jgi:hypothetical protein